MIDDDPTCAICGGEPGNFAVPTFNGDVVSNAFPESLWNNDGGARQVCERCYLMHERGAIVTHDARYLPWSRSPFGVALVDGAGI